MFTGSMQNQDIMTRGNEQSRVTSPQLRERERERERERDVLTCIIVVNGENATVLVGLAIVVALEVNEYFLRPVVHVLSEHTCSFSKDPPPTHTR